MAIYVDEPHKVDAYIKSFAPEVQEILQKIRALVKKHTPNATEGISYGIPTFYQKRTFFHYAAFKNHFSLFPPVSGDAELLQSIKPYANKKNNLLFKYKNDIPYDLIEKVIINHIAQLENK
jgi:uncharacterized protein YdhG (YjbR/CyaY superfamily)